MLKYILLGFIWYKPSTGYELKQALDNSTGYFWHAYHSQIYTTLRKLEEEGLITTHLENGNDHLTRRVCEITEEGKSALIQWQNDPLTEISKIKEDLLVRIFFSGVRAAPEIEAELRLQRKLHQQQLDLYNKAMNCGFDDLQINSDNGHIGIDPALVDMLQDATLKFGIAYEEMYIQWLESLIEKLDQAATLET